MTLLLSPSPLPSTAAWIHAPIHILRSSASARARGLGAHRSRRARGGVARARRALGSHHKKVTSTETASTAAGFSSPRVSFFAMAASAVTT